MWTKSRLMAIQRIENDVRLLREKAQRLTDAAGADIEGCKAAISNAEAALKTAVAAEKEQRQLARGLLKDAEKVAEPLAGLRRELDKAPPAPVEAPVG